MSAAAAGNAAGRFADRATESLYQSYNAKQKRAAFACYVSASVLFDVYCLTVYDRWSPWTWSLLAVNLATLLWCRVAGGRRRHWSAMAHLAWFTSVVQVVFHMVANTADGADLLGWILLYDYLTYVSLPVTLTLCVALSATTCITYVLTMAALADHHAYLARQVMCQPPPPSFLLHFICRQFRFGFSLHNSINKTGSIWAMRLSVTRQRPCTYIRHVQ